MWWGSGGDYGGVRSDGGEDLQGMWGGSRSGRGDGGGGVGGGAGSKDDDVPLLRSRPR